VIRQLLTESVFLALLGGALGIGLAGWGTGLFSKLGPAHLPVASASAVNWIVLAFSTALATSAGVLFGLAPAVQLSSLNLDEFLKERGGGPAVGGGRLRSLLMISEVAVSVILLIAAGLLIRSFIHLHEVDPGFATKNIATIPVELPRFSYPGPSQQALLYRQVIGRVGRLPGVESVGAIDDLPLTSDRDATSFTIEGLPPFPLGQTPFTQVRTVTPDYFRTMHIPIIQGRSVSEQDTVSALPVIVINQSFARRFFLREDPIGRRMKFGLPTERSRWLAIVGVVGDVRDLGLEAKADLEVYLPYEQNPSSYMNLVVATKDNPSALATGLREEIHRLDKDLPLLSVRSMEAVLAESMSERQFMMSLMGVFAGLALLLAAVGVYGVISYSVSQQTRHIGIRIALGAQCGDVLKLVLKKAIREALLGVVIGLAGALALTRIIKGQLYQVSTADPITLGGVVLLLLTTALIASWLPARRAAKVDPMEALRYE
jgi:putative ABC transport system permease protein